MKPVASRRPYTSDQIVSLELPVVKTESALLGRIDSFAGHQRAFLKVQDGCDAHCTYCIIPRLRPTLRSKPIEVAVAEARALVRAGHKELVVTGIFLGAYGRETAIRRRFPSGRSPLAALVEALAGVEGLVRLRLSSLEPGDVDDELLAVLSAHPVCVPHLHLPLQSGSPAILRRMNRQYGREAYLSTLDRVRAALDRPAVSTDVIVGFPGETEADFQATLEVAREASFVKIHAFPFSPRSQTAAGRWMKDFVHPSVCQERMQRLAKAEIEGSMAFRRRFLGAVERVIVEPPSAGTQDAGAPVVRHGRTDRYFDVFFEADADIETGDVVPIRVEYVGPTRTRGARLPPGRVEVTLPVVRPTGTTAACDHPS